MPKERDRAPCVDPRPEFSPLAPSSSAMIPPASAPPNYYNHHQHQLQQQQTQAQPLSSPDPRSYAHFGIKPDPNSSLETGTTSDAMATRRASLVVPPRSQEEPEQEHQAVKSDPEPSKSETKTTSATPMEPKKTEVHVIRKRNVGVPKFLRFLFQILEVEDEDVISWSHQGTAFQIRQPDELADKILPKYFKHNKVSSFQRQLNYFGFKKWTKTQTNICTFSHPFFLQTDKDMMKLIKRKERVNTTGFAAIAASTSSIEAQNQAQAQLKAEAAVFAQIQSQMPQQQALKRQKSNTMAPMVSGQTAAFLNSAMAGRRHSTGMLPGSEAFGLAAAAAAASASAAEVRKTEGTPAELELGLELEARSDTLAQATTPQQQFLHLQKLAEARELSMRYPSQSARGKRKSLPHVLPPSFGDTLGVGVNINMSAGSNFNPGGAMNFGRCRRDQLLNEFVSGSSSGSRAPLMGQFVRILSPSTSSPPQQLVFANSNTKHEASLVLPMSNPPGGYQQQQQGEQMNRQPNMYGRGPGFGSANVIKTESRSGWPPSVNVSPPSSITNLSFQMQQQNNQLMSIRPFKFGDSSEAQNSMSSFEGGVSIVDYPNGSSGAEPKFQQRPLFSHLQQQYQSQQQEPQSYQEHSSQQEQPRDYIDVLLESAALDDVQSSSVLPSGSWGDTSYAQHGSSTSGPTGPYPLMQHQQLQLSPMGSIPHYPNQRF